MAMILFYKKVSNANLQAFPAFGLDDDDDGASSRSSSLVIASSGSTSTLSMAVSQPNAERPNTAISQMMCGKKYVKRQVQCRLR